MNKKILLPIALFAATTLGGTAYINSQNNDNKNKIELAEQKDKKVDEKDVFDYMKYTSVPVKENNNGLNLAMGLFGLGIAGVKRKEYALKCLDEIEDFAAKTPVCGGNVDEQILTQCKILRDCIDTEDCSEIDEKLAESAAGTIEDYIMFHLNQNPAWSKPFASINGIISMLNDGTIPVDNDKYRKECAIKLDNIIKQITDLSKGDVYLNITKGITENEIQQLRRLISEGESDFPQLKEEILELLEKQENSLNHLSDVRPEQIAVDMYSRVPRLLYLVTKYTSTKDDWECSKVKSRFPLFEGKVDEEVYAKFNADTLQNCRKLKSEVKNNQRRNIAMLISIIKQDILNHGTYDTKAFGNAMLICDMILKQCNPAEGSYNGSIAELTRYVKMLLENVFNSGYNSANITSFSTVPRTFEEWEADMKAAEIGGKEFKFPGIGTITKDFKPDITELKHRRDEAFEALEWQVKEQKLKAREKSKKTGKSSANNITFDSIGGQDKAIEQLKKKVLYPIKYPNAFRNRMLDRGIILYGRPGTGKTLMALALSNEAEAHFIKIKANQLTSEFHGKTDENWRNLFEEARQNQPCIIFIDEFDTVGQKRGHNTTNTYDDTVINTILAEMSDIEKDGDNIFIIGATNRFNVLDDGLTRSGRFGTFIEIKAPETVEDVLQIFDIHTRDKALDENIDKNKLAQMMLKKNVTGGDIAKIVNEALENTFLRLGIYEKMEKGTFDDSDLSDIKTTMGDFVDAIENFEVVYDKKSEKRSIIGFNKR